MYIYIYVCVCVLGVHTYIHTHIYIYIYTYIGKRSSALQKQKDKRGTRLQVDARGSHCPCGDELQQKECPFGPSTVPWIGLWPAIAAQLLQHHICLLRKCQHWRIEEDQVVPSRGGLCKRRLQLRNTTDCSNHARVFGLSACLG